MSVVRTGEGANFTLDVGDLDASVLRLQRFHGTEGVSELFGFDLDLVSTDAAVSFDDVVGKPAHFAWHTTDSESRTVHGIISRFQRTGASKKLAHYAARLVPKVWTLTLIRQSRIFQNKSTPEILKAVLEKAGIPADQYKQSLKGDYPPRKYCVQYRESDFDFISRLMEEEGIWYCFEHDEEQCVMVMGDDASTPAVIEGEEAVVFREGEGGMAGGESVNGFRYGRSMETGAVVLQEYDFKKPKQKLKVEAKAETDSHLQSYDYPGEYPDATLGKRMAQVRLEEHQAERELGVGESNCRRLISGYRFKLDEHPVEELNQEYLLLRLEHWGEQGQGGQEGGGGGMGGRVYENVFECIPSAIAWRPPRVTPRPRVEGPQTAMVTGPSGEEIHVDEFGRVKVRFHWDLEGPEDDKSSCWVRVSQGYSAGWVFLPRVGQEAIVEFLEGDPDRPLITGRSYNGTNIHPYALPGSKTKSSIQSQTSPGGGSSNEVRFEDRAGSEEMFMNASKDMSIDVANNKTKSVVSNEMWTVGSDQTWSIGSNQDLKIDENAQLTVGGNEILNVDGDQREEITGNQSITIGGMKLERVKGNMNEAVGGSKSETIGLASALLVKGDMTEESESTWLTKVGALQLIKVKGDAKLDSKGKVSTVCTAVRRKVTGDIEVEAKALHVTIVGGTYQVKGSEITIKADAIMLTVGGSLIKLASGNVSIESSDIEMKCSGSLEDKGSVIPKN